ncbi:hypothetical protein SEPCBS57363_000054 [Sporothrix epigloea]|uniref:Siderophore esterase IroE-like protein n=1 Tax=Sporothrix epigloea TaxID=1892477 RepID=A0ABP0D4D2_9PEZI
MTLLPANTQFGVPNSLQRLIDTEHGVLQIMVSWPLGWKDNGMPADDKENVSDVSVIYVLDGDAYFLAATDIVRRQQYTARKKAIIVGIGYPGHDAVYVPARRFFDLSPPASKGVPRWPAKDADGNEEKDEHGNTKYWELGGAAHFQQTLVNKIMPALAHDMLPGLPWDSMRKVLYGHSFGGLFTLYSLFTNPGLFDVYIAASPSIWFNDKALVDEQEQHFMQWTPPDTESKKPLLYITSGTAEEDDVFRKPGETDEKLKVRRGFLERNRINTNAREMAKRLDASGKLGQVWLQEFSLEDHASAAVVGLQRGLNKLIGEWWEGK